MKIIPYQKKLNLFFILLFSYLLAVIVLNYYEDPGNQFSQANSYENKLATALLANKSIMSRINYDDRSVQKIMLNKLHPQTDVLILGSSRVMPLNQDLSKNLSVYNAGVPSATLEDDIALYYLYSKNGIKPKIVVICLDPWILDANADQLWKNSFLTEYKSASQLFFGDTKNTKFVEKVNIALDKYSQLLSLNYFKASIKKIKTFHNASSTEIIVSRDTQSYPNYALREPNGARLPSRNDEETSAEKADISGVTRIQELSEGYSRFTRLDPTYTELLDKFISYLTANHVEVVLYLPPYEPVAYTAMHKDPHYKMFDAAEEFFISYGNLHHLKIIGSYNPEKTLSDASDFVDYYHLKKKGIDKIFQKEFGTRSLTHAI